ncbi:hypothetical protein V6N12_057010 [Hibiscus sabdariffa]|uniref:Uncharacterized protein n=1 Tax=Hibiscus sabdariffa TaxID=183260 RepID=A0ABR2DDM4_9ROSI
MFLALTVGIKKRSDSKVAQKTWELENSILTVPLKPSSSRRSLDSWANDRHYFKCCMISVLALLKMVARARSGGTTVVMGLMQGKTDADSIIVMYAFALHVEDTETRVNANADADAYEYMVDYYQTNEQVITRPKLMAFERLKTGVHCKQKARPSLSSLFWIPLFHLAAEKLEQVETRESNATRLHWPTRPSSKEELHVDKITRDGAKVTTEQVHGLMAQSNHSCLDPYLPSFVMAATKASSNAVLLDANSLGFYDITVSMKDHPDYPSLHDCSLSLSLDCYGIPKESNPNQQQPSDFSVIGQPRVLALRRRDLGLHCLLSRWFNLGFYWKLIYRYTSWEF